MTTDTQREALRACPWCGATDGRPVADESQGTKWGHVRCSCGITGPEVRTDYDLSDNAPWHADAIAAWNTRAAPAAVRGGVDSGATYAEMHADREAERFCDANCCWSEHHADCRYIAALAAHKQEDRP